MALWTLGNIPRNICPVSLFHETGHIFLGFPPLIIFSFVIAFRYFVYNVNFREKKIVGVIVTGLPYNPLPKKNTFPGVL